MVSIKGMRIHCNLKIGFCQEKVCWADLEINISGDVKRLCTRVQRRMLNFTRLTLDAHISVFNILD